MSAKIIQSEEIETREDFALLCNWRKCFKGVEIGTDRGEFAVEFLSKWHGSQLICVDDFEPHPDFPFDRTGDFAFATLALSKFAGRVRLVKSQSRKVAENWQFPFLPEFIYVDGSHEYDAVLADLRCWHPLLSPVGIMAGHDFDAGHGGVMRAVTEYADSKNRIVRVTADDPPSWYFYANDPTPAWRRIAR